VRAAAEGEGSRFAKLLHTRICLSETSMPAPRAVLDDIAKHLRSLAAESPAGDLERNFRALLSGTLARLDLVTREEFDAQARVLARTREKLEALEQRVASLESTQDNAR
jgi:BMFP domain-containing protein YqiC